MAGISSRRGGVTFDLRTEPSLKEFQFRVDRFTEGITDWSRCLSACGKLFQRQMALQFETEGAISGEPWEQLSEVYETWKEQNYPGQPIGVLEGDLRSSMTGGGGYSERIDKTSADFGMSPDSPAADYGEFFSEVRPVIRMTPDWGREYQKVVHAWLVAEERGSMGIGGANIGEMVRLGGVTPNLQHIDWTEVE